MQSLHGKRFGVGPREKPREKIGRTHTAIGDAQAKRALEADLQEEDRKKSHHEKKEESKKEKRERQREKQSRKGRKRKQITGVHRLQTHHKVHKWTRERDGHTPSEEGDASNLWRGQIIDITMPASNDERLHAAENDINTLVKNSDVLLRGMKQIQKQHNYFMQRDNNQARKEANMQAVIPNWPAQAQEQDRDHIIDWLGMLRFPHASSNLPPARCKQTHFHKFHFYIS